MFLPHLVITSHRRVAETALGFPSVLPGSFAMAERIITFAMHHWQLRCEFSVSFEWPHGVLGTLP